MQPPANQLLAVGTRGFRVLDGVRFACEIVALETNDDDDDGDDDCTLTVRFTDDHTIEHGVERDEFEAELGTVDADADAIHAPPLSQVHNAVLYNPQLLGRIASFLSRLQWITTLIRVNHTWRTTLLSKASHWHNLRLPASKRTFHRIRHLLDVQLLCSNNNNNHLTTTSPPTLTVSQAIRQLVLDNSAVTDDQVLALVHKCPQVTHVSLRRCANVSFMLVYELQQLARERRCRTTTTTAATTTTTTSSTSDADKSELESEVVPGSASLETLDLWLCSGISPSYVSQLTTRTDTNSTTKKRPALTIYSPGFYCVDVPARVYETLCAIATQVQGWNPAKLSVTWIERETLLATLQEQTDCVWSPLRRFVPLFKAFSTSTPVSVVPLVRLDPLLLRTTEESTRSHVTMGLPASLADDLVRLVEEYEPESTRQHLISLVLSMVEVMKLPTGDEDNTSKANETRKQEDSLEAQATRVFAMLRQTTQQLQAQVDHLEHQVAEMTTAKNKAEQDYKSAERELKRVSQEADRALLSLATSQDSATDTNKTQLSASGTTTTSMIQPPPQNGIVTCRPEDTFLPALPSRERICELAQALESQCFAVLDGFVGTELSGQVRRDAERLYQTSRVSETQPSMLLPPPPPPGKEQQEEQLCDSSTGQFRLGELAGGNTGRNLRYQMAHVRGDYVLWLDEHDPFCPRSLQLVLRQLDRLILERLSVESHELSMSALLRKKAMVTCYPGKSHAQYTRHCDNPNRNGRKLTAILYLNDNWTPARHGGELRLHLPNAAAAGGGSGGETVVVGVSPVLDRLLLFFSDTRVPHEVRPCTDETTDRFALTVWYMDYDEYMHAQVFGAAVAKTKTHDMDTNTDTNTNTERNVGTVTEQDREALERRRIEREIQRLQKTNPKTETLAGLDGDAPTVEQHGTKHKRQGGSADEEDWVVELLSPLLKTSCSSRGGDSGANSVVGSWRWDDGGGDDGDGDTTGAAPSKGRDGDEGWTSATVAVWVTTRSRQSSWKWWCS